MVQLLSEWMETFPYDFRDERVMQHVRQLTQRCVALDPSLRRDVSQMLHNLLHRLTALEKYEEFLEKINTEASAALIDTVNVVRYLFLLHPRTYVDTKARFSHRYVTSKDLVFFPSILTEGRDGSVLQSAYAGPAVDAY